MMSRRMLAMAAVAVGGLAVAPASAQFTPGGQYSQGVSGYYDDAAVTSSRPVTPAAGYNNTAANYAVNQNAHGQAGAGCTSCGGHSCGHCAGHGGYRRGLGCGPLCCPEEYPWRLFDNFNQGNRAGVQVHGWVNGGFTANGDDPPSNYNGVVTFNDRDEGMLNQLYLVTERTLDTHGRGFDWGGRVDFLYGTDSRFTEARGLETDRDGGTKWNTEPFYGVAMPQAYLEAGVNNLSVKAGHFYTIVGYESVMATSNFFYSHAYTMQYGEPFTHTGVLATWTPNDCWTFHAGFDRGWDNWEDDDNNRLSFLGGATWTDGNGLSLAIAGTAGQEPTDQGAGSATVNDDRFFYSAVLTKEWNRLTYVLQHDYGFQDLAIGGVQDAEWYGINQYAFYKLNCCWTFGVRAEWFRDDDGFRVQGIGDRRNGHPLGNARFVGNFYEVTVGANWKPNDNLVVRPEVRFDWFDADGAPAVLPFDDGTSDDQILFAIDAILLY